MKTWLRVILQRLDHIVRTPDLRIYFISIFMLILVSTLLLYLNNMGASYELKLGDIVPEDIKVSRDIHYVNHEETEMKKEQARSSVLPVFDRDASVLMEKLKVVGMLFGSMEVILEENPPIGTDDLTFQLLALKSRIPSYLHYSDEVLLEMLRYGNPSELKKIVYRVLIYVYDNNDVGVLDEPYRDKLNLTPSNITVRTLRGNAGTSEVTRNIDDLRLVEETKENAYSLTYSTAPHLTRSLTRALARVVKNNIEPNMRFNEEETKRRINERATKIKSAMSVLKKNQVIAREGDIITADIMDKIEILNKRAATSRKGYLLGIFLLQFIFMLVFGYFMVEFNQVLIPEMKSSLIIFTVMIFFMIYTFMISGVEQVHESKILYSLFLPIPMVTMIVTILYNSYLAMFLGIHLIFFTSVIAGGDFSVTVMSFSSAVIGIIVVGNVERRTDFLRGGFILGVIMALITVTLGFFEERPVTTVTGKLYIPLLHGMVNSILVMGFLPLFENLFGITTRFRLLELSDLNASIFKKMLVKAPGSYNHSIIVANMAETACKDIQANYLLARVGAYYHDIGKIENADMFIENRPSYTRPADIPPLEYCQIIIDHVPRGADLAKQNGLPESVIDFIREHHGQSVMAFFYHQALEKAKKEGNPEEVNRSDYQYNGPRPHSRETAVVMLADSIEAASRTIQEPTYAKLEGLVSRIIFNKLNEGELEYSDLSMSELKKIQKSFLRILNGIFHTRIEYPEESDVRRLENENLRPAEK